MTDPTDEQVGRHIDGWGIGNTDGRVICDDCGRRIHLEVGEAEAMLGYVTGRRGNSMDVHLLKVYCYKCHTNHEEIGTPTSGVYEAIVSLDVVRESAQPEARDTTVMNKSPTRQGHP